MKIYIADDEKNIREIIAMFLKKEGYEVEVFEDGRSLLEVFEEKPSDMVIIDIMMPNMDGYSLCGALRKISGVPIIFVSARDSEPDKVAGLMIGGDDYLTKPFSPMELVARVKSIFRRIDFEKGKEKEEKREEIIKVKDLSIIENLKEVRFEDKAINFTPLEYNLISYLIKNKNKAISRDELLNKVWGYEAEVETRATDDMVKRIRKKLKEIGSVTKIETVWGFGFKIEERED